MSFKPRQYAPHILTAFAVFGVFTTAWYAADGHQRAQRERYELGNTRQETILNAAKARWKYYAPATVSGILTVIAMCSATKISLDREQVAQLAGQAISDSYCAYRRAVKESVTGEKYKEINDLNAKRKASLVQEIPPPPPGSGEPLSLFLDELSGRYYYVDIGQLRVAEKEVSVRLFGGEAISVNQFYELVGLPTIALGDQLGWPTGTQFEVLLGSALSNTSRPCAVITFDPEPVAGYFRIN